MRILTVLAMVAVVGLLAGCAAMSDLADASGEAVGDLFGVPTKAEVEDLAQRPDNEGIGWGQGGLLSIGAMFVLHVIRNYTRRRQLRVISEGEKPVA